MFPLYPGTNAYLHGLVELVGNNFRTEQKHCLYIEMCGSTTILCNIMHMIAMCIVSICWFYICIVYMHLR